MLSGGEYGLVVFDLFVWRVLLRLVGLEVMVSGLLFVIGLRWCFGCRGYRSRICCRIGIWVFWCMFYAPSGLVLCCSGMSSVWR